MASAGANVPKAEPKATPKTVPTSPPQGGTSSIEHAGGTEVPPAPTRRWTPAPVPAPRTPTDAEMLTTSSPPQGGTAQPTTPTLPMFATPTPTTDLPQGAPPQGGHPGSSSEATAPQGALQATPPQGGWPRDETVQLTVSRASLVAIYQWFRPAQWHAAKFVAEGALPQALANSLHDFHLALRSPGSQWRGRSFAIPNGCRVAATRVRSLSYNPRESGGICAWTTKSARHFTSPQSATST